MQIWHAGEWESSVTTNLKEWENNVTTNFIDRLTVKIDGEW